MEATWLRRRPSPFGDGSAAVAMLQQAVGAFPKVRELIWVQEEPANMGALQSIVPRLQQEFGTALNLRTASRVESASPATGSYKAHVLEQQKLMNDAFAERAPGDKN